MKAEVRDLGLKKVGDHWARVYVMYISSSEGVRVSTIIICISYSNMVLNWRMAVLITKSSLSSLNPPICLRDILFQGGYNGWTIRQQCGKI